MTFMMTMMIIIIVIIIMIIRNQVWRWWVEAPEHHKLGKPEQILLRTQLVGFIMLV